MAMTRMATRRATFLGQVRRGVLEVEAPGPGVGEEALDGPSLAVGGERAGVRAVGGDDDRLAILGAHGANGDGGSGRAVAGHGVEGDGGLAPSAGPDEQAAEAAGPALGGGGALPGDRE